MPDNLQRKAPEDPTKINMNQSWEVDYWMGKFGVTKAKLQEAVNAVGVMVADVKRYLGK